jgi:acetyl esterase/lipase
MKRKPPGEAALVDFTRRRFRSPEWMIRMHSLGRRIEAVSDAVKGEWVSGPDETASECVILYLHGGGYISGSAKSARPITAILSREARARAFSLEYRLAPEHRFPAALDDAVAGYRWLLLSGIASGNIAFAGDSAGGGLALALALRLRDAGEALPACLVCLSPWTDMTGSGDSIRNNSKRDPMFEGEDIPRYASVYLGEHERMDPLASPLFADLRGLPPTLIQVGRNEVLLDDARGLHQKLLAAGVESELHIYKHVPHGWHYGAPFVPETREALCEIARFVRRNTAKKE